MIGERPERARRGRSAVPGDLVDGEDLVGSVAVEVSLDDLPEEAARERVRPGDLQRAGVSCVGGERDALSAGSRCTVRIH